MGQQKWADACTCNCVWLFQRAEYFYKLDGSDYHYDDDKECILDEDGNEPDLQELLDNEAVFKHWHTSAVFLTRVEGVDFGFRRHYDHGKYGEDWRLYGVPACGEMVDLLAQAGVNQAYIDEREPKADKAVQEWQEQLAKR